MVRHNHAIAARVNDTLQRIWTALRISRSSDMAMLALQAECPIGEVREYVGALANAGYCVVSGPKGAHQRFRLLRDCGPSAPRLNDQGVMTDANIRHRVTRKPRPLRAPVAIMPKRKEKPADTRQAVWELLTKGSYVRAAQLASVMGRQPATIQRYLFELERGGYLRHRGPDFLVLRKTGPLAPRHVVRVEGTEKADFLHDVNEGRDYPMARPIRERKTA